MAIINLEFDPEGETLILRGADASIIRHPLFASYLRQVGGSLRADGSMQLPTAADALTGRYQQVTKVLSRLGASIETGGNVSNLLDRVADEERRFSIFSKEAYDIWHRQIDTEAFRLFVSAVESLCPGRTFYRKQLLSAFHLAFAQNACNFSVPGAGKTSIVYAAYAYLKSLPAQHDKHTSRLLIVGPLSSFKAWEDEYESIFLRVADAKRISGSMSAIERADHLRGIRFGSRDIEIVLTSYPTLAASEDDFRAYLSRPGVPAMMVLDEAHYIKRDDGIWASAALRLAPLAGSRVILTGTPAPNGYEDLANLFKFIYPSRQIVGFPAASLKAMSDGAMARAVPELKAKIQPFYTRIRKVDLGLPEVRQIRCPVPMRDTHQRIYRSLERRIVPQLRQDLDSPGMPVRVKARLIRLRQASVNPELLLRPLEDEGVFETGGFGDFSISELEIMDLVRRFAANRDLERLEICRDLVSDVLREQKKVLIWSYFLGNLALLHRCFAGSVPFVEVLTGATPISGGDPEDEPGLGTREEIIERFHRTTSKGILIANPQAVGESISLHKACRTAIYFDRDFNAGRFIQSKDRIHRYNPHEQLLVSYYYLVSQGTVDEDIDRRLITKERRLSDLVDVDDIPLFTSSEDDDADDIKAILEAYERRKTL